MPRRSKPHQDQLDFTLPPELVSEARRFADAFHDGNNSGFVATAIRHYIEHLRKARHTAKLRQSYAAAAADARLVAREWDAVSEEAWAKLDAKSRSRA